MTITIDQKVKVLLACPGIGHIKRGFESFTQELFETLKTSNKLEVWLAKGAGSNSSNEFNVLCFKRKTIFAKFLAKIFLRDPYFIEQLSFSIFLVPWLIRNKPDVVYFSDGTIGNVLWRIRKYFSLDFKLIFSNGAPFLPPYCKCDIIQQVLPHLLDQSDTRQKFIPYGFKIDQELTVLSESQQLELRKKLSLPLDKKIILSVAAIAKSHKRIDYLIQEVAKLNGNTFLLVLGEETDETPELNKLALSLLGKNNFSFRSVSHTEISDYYKVADIMCHVALQEGFGRILVEALAQGLTIITHDSPGSRYVLGEYAVYADLSQKNQLFETTKQALSQIPCPLEKILAKHKYAFERFSWQQLKPQYIDIIYRT
jgi:1,2-diacylglycerol 3-alpha-glucosyltransferase